MCRYHLFSPVFVDLLITIEEAWNKKERALSTAIDKALSIHYSS